MNTTSVLPIYGWGWTDEHAIVETPERFDAALEQRDGELGGIIQSGQFEGWSIAMTKRHSGVFDGFVNVRIISPDRDKKLGGFAEISKDLLY